VPALVGPGNVMVMSTNGCGGNTQFKGSWHDVIAVS
jgi:hypothetical protein